jgi:hypothetical protein
LLSVASRAVVFAETVVRFATHRGIAVLTGPRVAVPVCVVRGGESAAAKGRGAQALLWRVLIALNGPRQALLPVSAAADGYIGGRLIIV